MRMQNQKGRHCPTCQRRWPRIERPEQQCRVCAAPIEYQGAGRPRVTCPGCRATARKLEAAKRDAH